MSPVAKIRRAVVRRPKRAARATDVSDIARHPDATIAVVFEPRSGNLARLEAAKGIEDGSALLVRGAWKSGRALLMINEAGSRPTEWCTSRESWPGWTRTQLTTADRRAD